MLRVRSDHFFEFRAQVELSPGELIQFQFMRIQAHSKNVHGKKPQHNSLGSLCTVLRLTEKGAGGPEYKCIDEEVLS